MKFGHFLVRKTPLRVILQVAMKQWSPPEARRRANGPKVPEAQKGCY